VQVDSTYCWECTLLLFPSLSPPSYPLPLPLATPQRNTTMQHHNVTSQCNKYLLWLRCGVALLRCVVVLHCGVVLHVASHVMLRAVLRMCRCCVVALRCCVVALRCCVACCSVVLRVVLHVVLHVVLLSRFFLPLLSPSLHLLSTYVFGFLIFRMFATFSFF
jgi:hypothetical protein